jgi:hypothetical protein
MAIEPINSRRYRKQRELVFKMHGRVCAYCGTDEGEMHIDHIIPRSKGGDHSLDNLQVLCKPCNQAKGAKETFFPTQGATPPVFSAFLSPTRSIPAEDSPFTRKPSQIEPE